MSLRSLRNIRYRYLKGFVYKNNDVSVYTVSKVTALCSSLYFKGFLHNKQPQKIECLPPEQREGMFTAYYKRLSFPKFNIPLM